ncbi:retinol dehydrogenase 11 [Aspergillus pseudoustus]|uniref:Retinol dehydrogenase 11 n=1 Tax=Aspergillus pseudoustus TaxID=1810923 RepID=A0ABR4J1X4_9EURO
MRPAFRPQDIPDLSGKVFFITGGTAGLGAATALELAKQNAARIYISGRNAQAASSVIEQIRSVSKTNVTFIKCDLASLSSVKDAATDFLSKETRLDVLLCSAGIMATDPGLTRDGYEIQFGTNHLGHAMLIRHLLPLLQATSDDREGGVDARIVILTSLGFKMAAFGTSGILFDELKTTQDKGFMWSWFRYGQSKLANLLYAKELARRYPGITSVSIHPGVIRTGLVEGMGAVKRWFVYVSNVGKMVSLEEGAYNSLWATTTSKEKVANGAFYEPVGKLGGLDSRAKDEGLAGELWEWTQKVLDEYDS